MSGVVSPKIVSQVANEQFYEFARSHGLDPDNPWIGGYVDYEWEHIRHIFEALSPPVRDLDVLEFGCNVGASTIVLAALGAKVKAIDVSRTYIQLGTLNAHRYGVGDAVDFLYIEDTRHMPFANGAFDLICCNSVLEYVPFEMLPNVQMELNRLLKPGGRILITGTSNRLWPRDLHGGLWLVNYIPRFLDKLFYRSNSPERGVFPWQLRYGFGENYENLDWKDRGQSYIGVRLRLMSSRKKRWLFKLFCHLCLFARMPPGLMGHSISMLLEKPVQS